MNLKGKMKPLGTEEWEKGIEWEAEGKPNRFYVLIVFLEHKAGFPLKIIFNLWQAINTRCQLITFFSGMITLKTPSKQSIYFIYLL